MKGNEAIAESALRNGCRYFFGYPITPQSEIPEYMAKRMPEVGGVFIQSESETSAINMVYGASGAGARVMTSSSSPGISLKQEGISYIAAAELPCVIVNIVRGGPGLGSIQPSQGDYFQSVKGGGHGDYKLLVYAPNSVQEAAQLTYKAFDKADEYRTPVLILGDGILGQMMESVELPPERDILTLPKKPWATVGNEGRGKNNIINTLEMDAAILENNTLRLFEKYKKMEQTEVIAERYMTEDAEVVFAAYGITSRIAKSAVDELRARGIKAGLIRPVTLFPFPTAIFEGVAKQKSVEKFITVELSMGQMVEDVRLAVNGLKPVEFFGRVGGNVMTPADIVKRAMGAGESTAAGAATKVPTKNAATGTPAKVPAKTAATKTAAKKPAAARKGGAK
jgi:2-oxoglutarate ferredoxin oxidoreductase subunit alpha